MNYKTLLPIAMIKTALDNRNKKTRSTTSSHDWRTAIDAREITNLLTQLGLKDYQLDRIVGRYLVDNNRCAIKAILRNTSDNHLKKVIMDLISGDPTWRQFIDVTYNIGADCDLRIIVYEDGGQMNRDLENPGNPVFIKQLVVQNNRCGLNTYLVEATGITREKSAGNIRYCSSAEVRVSQDTPLEELPPRSKIEAMEFINEWYEPYYEEFSSAVKGKIVSSFLGPPLINGLGTGIVWNENGLSISILGEPGNKDLNWFWKNRQKGIDRTFTNRKITMERKPGKPNRLCFHVSDVLFRDCLLSDPDKKDYYGSLVYDEVSTIVFLLGKLLEDREEKLKKKPCNAKHLPLTCTMDKT